MNTTQLIAFLNAIEVGPMDRIRAKLEQAKRACIAMDQAELATKLSEATDALSSADLRTYRRRIETVIAKLGHLR